MPTRVLNLCLDVHASGVVVNLQGHTGPNTPPTDPPYWFQILFKDDPPALSSGESVTLSEIGPYRILAWDGKPSDEVPATTYTEPTWQSPSVEWSASGGEFVVTSAGAQDPWPPT